MEVLETNLTPAKLKAMDFEDFAEVCDRCGWSAGSPERQSETAELMFS